MIDLGVYIHTYNWLLFWNAYHTKLKQFSDIHIFNTKKKVSIKFYDSIITIILYVSNKGKCCVSNLVYSFKLSRSTINGNVLVVNAQIAGQLKWLNYYGSFLF